MKNKITESGIERDKRVFITLLLLTCGGLVIAAALLWFITFPGFERIHPWLPFIMGLFFALAVIYFTVEGLALAFSVFSEKNLFFNRRIRGVVIKFLFPLLVITGRLFGIGKDQMRRSFIAVNNQLVLNEAEKSKPEKLLILLPHCLQNHECAVRITGDIENCRSCGKCRIMDLLEMSRRYGVAVSVATGGTLARRIVTEKRPDVIVAVACERDLTSGIQDSYPIPVLGVLNRRPFGPCYDTDVDIDMVEQVIRYFLGA